MRRRLLLVATVAVVTLGAIRVLVVPTTYYGYRQIDDYNIALAVTGASPMWRGVTEHTETASTITIGVSEIRRIEFGAGFGDERMAYVTVRLTDPLAGRQVIDASTGNSIPRIAP